LKHNILSVAKPHSICVLHVILLSEFSYKRWNIRQTYYQTKMTPQFIVLAIISIASALPTASPQFGYGGLGMGYMGLGGFGMGMNPYMMGMGGMGMMWDEKTKTYVKDPENHAAQLGLKYKPSK
jgi:hypothetical protein